MAAQLAALYVRLQQYSGATQIVLGQKRPVRGVADIAAKPGGGIRVSALAHIVGAKLVVVAEFAGAFGGEQASGERASVAIQKAFRSETRSLGPPAFTMRAWY